MFPLNNALGPLGGRPRSLPWSTGSTLLDGLVSWWNLDETSGVRYDAVGSNDLTDNNTVGYAGGKIGNAASFVKAQTEYLSTAYTATLDLPTAFTYSCWFKTDSGGTYNGLMGWGEVFPQMNIHVQGNIIVCRFMDNAANWAVVGSTVALHDDEWHHAVFWWDTAEKKMYMEWDGGVGGGGGENVSAALPSGTLKSASGLTWNIGYWVGGGGYYEGEADMCGVWNRVLTADERTELYNAGASIKNDFSDNGEGFREGLVAYYDLDEASGTRYNSAHVMSDSLQTGLVNFWEMDEASGTRYDAVGSDDLTEVGSVNAAPGLIGKAPDFTVGVGHSLILPDANWHVNNFFCISFWWKTTAGVYPLTKFDGSAGGQGIFFGDSGVIYFDNGGTTITVPGLSGSTGGVWRHAVIVYDGTQSAADRLIAYINGQAVSTTGTAPTNANSNLSRWEVCSTGGAGAYGITGSVDCFGRWSRALTASEALDLYNNGMGRHQGTSLALTDVNTVGSAAGVSGNAADFVAVNTEYLNLASFTAPASAFTVSAWIANDNPLGNGDIVGSVNIWPNSAQFALYLSGGNLYFLVSSGTGYAYDVMAPPAAFDSGWFHVLGWYDPADGIAHVAINGVAGGTPVGANATTYNTAAPLTVGNGPGAGYFDGRIDETAIYSRKLSAAEITALYAAGAGRFYDFNTTL